MAKSEPGLPKLTAEQVHAHERFAWMEIAVEELLHACRGAIEFDSGSTGRPTESYSAISNPKSLSYFLANGVCGKWSRLCEEQAWRKRPGEACSRRAVVHRRCW
jgi:hypothetical protein